MSIVNDIQPIRFLILSAVACGGLTPDRARAEFVMNFTVSSEFEQPGRDSAIRTTYWNSDNEWGAQGYQTGDLSNGSPAQTPYLYDANSLERPQIVTDPDTGKTYYHMIFGDLADGFIQESYIEMGGLGDYGTTSLGEPSDSASASGGYSNYNSVTTFGNGYDPLDMDVDAAAQAVTSGNGTGNPTRVIIRQIMADGEIMTEFLKDKYNTKPRVSQLLMGPDIMMMFDADMRAIDYQTDTTEAVISNIIQLNGPGVPVDSAYFDTSLSSQDGNIDGGKYTYTAGADRGESGGTYQYAEGDYDHLNIPWGNYLDKEIYNPWGFEAGKGQ